MSQATPKSAGDTRALLRAWRPLLATSLPTWSRACADQLGPMEDAKFRRTRQGYVVRWLADEGIVETVEISDSQIRMALAAQQAKGTEVGDWVLSSQFSPWIKRLACLSLLVVDRLQVKRPRGAAAKGARLALEIRAAAQELYADLKPMTVGGATEPWMDRLVRTARAAGVNPANAVELTAYAIHRFGEVNWPASRLKPLFREGVIDAEYFGAHYLCCPPTVTREGLARAKRIVDRLTPAGVRRAKAQRVDDTWRGLLDQLAREPDRARQHVQAAVAAVTRDVPSPGRRLSRRDRRALRQWAKREGTRFRALVAMVRRGR